MRSKLPVIGGVAILLAGAGVIAAIWSNGTKQSAACTPYIHAPVPAAAKKALAAYSGRIMHDIERSADGTRDEWWDDAVTGSRRQLAFDRSGKLESEFVDTRSGKVERSYWVLYPAHNVTATSQPIPAGLKQNGSRPEEIAQTNRDKVANRKATIVGRELIDGRQTLHLHEIVHIPAFNPRKLGVPKGFPVPPGAFRAQRFSVDTWVDPLTYLSVRTRSTGSTTDETWLPRTPANIAKTKLVVPAGFKRVVPQQGHAFGGFLKVIRKDSCQ